MRFIYLVNIAYAIIIMLSKFNKNKPHRIDEV